MSDKTTKKDNQLFNGIESPDKLKQEKVKRIAAVDSKELISTWIKKDVQFHPVYTDDGYLNIKQTVDNLLNSTKLNLENIPLEYKLILSNFAGGTVHYMEGFPGVGKTECARIIESLFHSLEIPARVILLNLAAMEVTDLTGEKLIPNGDSRFTINVISEELYEIREDKKTAYIIFLDEINRAHPHMVTAAMKLFDGTLNPRYSMTENTICLAAGNLGGMDDTDVTPFDEMDAAFKERVDRTTFSPNSTSWVLLNKNNKDIDKTLFSLVERSIANDSFQTFVFGDHKFRVMSPRRMTMFLVSLSKKKTLLSKDELIKYIEKEFSNTTIDRLYSDGDKVVSKSVLEEVDSKYRVKLSGNSGKAMIQTLKELFINWAKNENIDMSLFDVFNYNYEVNNFLNKFENNPTIRTYLNEVLTQKDSTESALSIRESLEKGFLDSNIVVQGNQKAEFSIFAIKNYKEKVINPMLQNDQNGILDTVFNSFMTNTFRNILSKKQYQGIFFTANIKTIEDISFDHIKKQFTNTKFLESFTVKNYRELFAIAIATSSDTGQSALHIRQTMREYFQSSM